MTFGTDAEIFDRGYRAYDGPRSGVAGAMRSVFIASIQRALGLRREFRYKVVPVATIMIAYVPALVFMGIGVLLPSEIADELVADYAGYFGLLGFAVILFTAFVAPELLSSDRNTGMFGLYLASPLNRMHYLVAKGASLVTVLFLVTLVPVLFLLVGYSFAGLGPDGFVETIETIAKICAGGLVMSVFFTLVGMAAATLTTRQGFASAGIVMAIVGSAALSSVLVEAADAPDWVQLFSLAAVPLDVVGRIFGSDVDQLTGVATWQSVGMWVAICALCIGVIAWGYRRMQVTK